MQLHGASAAAMERRLSSLFTSSRQTAPCMPTTRHNRMRRGYQPCRPPSVMMHDTSSSSSLCHAAAQQSQHALPPPETVPLSLPLVEPPKGATSSSLPSSLQPTSLPKHIAVRMFSIHYVWRRWFGVIILSYGIIQYYRTGTDMATRYYSYHSLVVSCGH